MSELEPRNDPSSFDDAELDDFIQPEPTAPTHDQIKQLISDLIGGDSPVPSYILNTYIATPDLDAKMSRIIYIDGSGGTGSFDYYWGTSPKDKKENADLP